MKIATTKERILQFIEYKGISKQTFFKLTGLKRGFLDADKLHTSMPDTFIATIIACFPELNPIWLLLGEGTMLKENKQLDATHEPFTMYNEDREALLYKMYREKDAEVKELSEQIGALKNEIENLREEITLIRTSSQFLSNVEFAQDVPAKEK